MSLMTGILIFGALAGTLSGGVRAANKQCEIVKQTRELREKTLQYISSSQKLFDNYEKIDASIIQEVDQLYIEISQMSATLKSLHDDFRTEYKKLEGIIIVIIMVTLLLLTAKKMGLLQGL